MITCVAGDPGGSCNTGILEVEETSASGRRLYIHEDSLTDLAAQGREQAILVFRMAARTVAIKAVHHMQQDAAMMGMKLGAGAVALQQTINAAWANNTTLALRRVGYRPSDPRTRAHLYRLLNDEEQIVASCYFSNYFTFATCARTAELMFADTNDIATMRRRMQETDEYRDLSLINGACLVLLDEEFGYGEHVSNQYFSRERKLLRVTAHDLAALKSEVYSETKSQLEAMMTFALDGAEANVSDGYIRSEVLKAVEYAFTKGILKAG